MTTAITCRKATAADQHAIWQVRAASIRSLCQSHYAEKETEAWGSVPVPDDFADVIRGREFLVAESDGVIVGFGFLSQQRWELEALFVEPRFARRGIGGKILASLEAIARSAGLRRLTLSASLNSVSFYQAAGYRAVRETTWHHPAGFGLPCVDMIKEL